MGKEYKQVLEKDHKFVLVQRRVGTDRICLMVDDGVDGEACAIILTPVETLKIATWLTDAANQ